MLFGHGRKKRANRLNFSSGFRKTNPEFDIPCGTIGRARLSKGCRKSRPPLTLRVLRIKFDLHAAFSAATPLKRVVFEGAFIPTSTQITPRNPQLVGTEDAEVAVPSLTLRDFIHVLRRRKMTVLLTFVAVLTLVAVNTLLSKPQYKSVASLLLEDNSGGSGASDSSGLGALFDVQSGMDVDSQVQLLNSPLILNQVYQDSKIERGTVQSSITRDGRTSKIDIIGISDSKENVQKFVATVPKVYQDNRRFQSAHEVTSQLKFARGDLAQENKRLDRAEDAVAAFKRRYNLFDPDSEAAAALSAATASKTALGTARADMSSLRAQIQALEGELATLKPTVDTPVVTTNPLIQDLRNQLATLQNQRKDQLFLYKETSDPIRQIDLQIANLKTRIANTAPTVTNNSTAPNSAVSDLRNRIASLRADLSAKQAAAGDLVEQVAKQDEGLGRYSTIQRQQAQLQRDLEDSQAAVKEGTENVRQLSVRARAMQAASAPITVLQPGTPGVKIAPNPVRNLILGAFVGLLLACAAALLQDSLDDRVRDEDEARQLLGAPILGYFPLMPVTDERQILDMNNPNRLLLESFRALRSNVQFALVNSAGKKIQITSTVPGEGKSYIASNLAITMALDGRRVILVDADLHRPTMHQRFGASRQPGLTNVLVGELNVQDALQDVGVNGLQLLSGGALPPNPAELLNSVTMVEVMKELESMADLVIFDTPPLLATSDSQLMSSKMDGVVFVMQMGSVARSGTVRAFELLKQANANVIGIVFNKVNASKSSTSYGNYSGHYALESNVSRDEVLDVSTKKLPPAARGSNGKSGGNGAAASSHGNGAQSNGAQNNGVPVNGSGQQTTVFDEAVRSDENAR